jgi:hypothetical protein
MFSLALYKPEELRAILANPGAYDYDTETLESMRQRLRQLETSAPILHESADNPLMAT